MKSLNKTDGDPLSNLLEQKKQLVGYAIAAFALVVLGEAAALILLTGALRLIAALCVAAIAPLLLCAGIRGYRAAKKEYETVAGRKAAE